MIKKTILMILNQSFLPDIRVEQECDALIEAGYRVVIIANNEGEISKKYEIIRINVTNGLSRYYNLSLKNNPLMINEIVEKLKSKNIIKIEAIHVHDLLWSFVGIQLQKIYKAKLVIDFHEPYAELIEITRRNIKIPLRHYLKVFLISLLNPKNDYLYNMLYSFSTRPSRLRRYEKKVIDICDRFIVVVEEAFKKIENKQRNKGIVVSNSKDPDKWNFEELPDLDNKLVVTYMGTIQDLRGVDTAIEAMKYLDKDKFLLNIVGVKKGGNLHSKFLEIIKKYNIENVNLVEFLKNEEKAFEYIKNTHIGIVPHKNSKLTQEALPHKMFMYMSKGRPVLVSDMAPLVRMVKESKNGYIFKSENPKDLSEKLELFYKNRNQLKQMALNGRVAVEKKYNWNIDKKNLINMYNEIL